MRKSLARKKFSSNKRFEGRKLSPRDSKEVQKRGQNGDNEVGAMKKIVLFTKSI